MFKNNNPHALQKELDGLSKVMGRSDVRTTFQGEGAYTDGKTINIPAMKLDAQLTDKEMEALRGYHIHEVAHITDTDNELWQSKRPTARKRHTWNAMEDVFIERKAQEKFSGARKSLQSTIDTVLERENAIDRETVEAGGDPYEDWPDQIDYAALQLARQRMGYDSPALDEYVNNLPDELRKEAEAFVDSALATDSTEETFKLAGKIASRMKKLGQQVSNDDEQKQQQQAQAGGDEEGQPAEEGGGAGSGGDAGGGDDGKASGNGSKGDDDSKPATSGADRMQRAGDVASQIAEAHKYDDNDRMERRVALTFKSYEDYYEYLRDECDKSPLVADKVWRQIGNYSHPHRSLNYGDLLKRLAEDATARSSGARLARLLLAREEKRSIGGQLDGRVDRRRLAQLVAGQHNVFTHQEAMRTDDTIVTVAVDASASMKERLTRVATAALNECLGRANCTYEILTWTGFSNSPYDITWGCKGLQKGEAPFNTNGLVEVKTSSQRSADPKVRDNIANMLTQVGVTPTLACLTGVAHRVVNHNEARRIVLMLTDGCPNGGYSEMDEVTVTANKMREAGIELIGIGIECEEDHVKRMFGDGNVVMCETRQLATTMFKQLENLLVGRAHEAA
jgi:cobalamin biosynthesis protein CobT